MKEERNMSPLDDDELDAVSGGGTYTKDGFLKTTNGYMCEHFECRCGFRNCDWPVTPTHHDCKLPFAGRSKNTCKFCKWHSVLKCSNPLNKKD